MEPVFARQEGRLLPNFDFVLADRTLRIAFAPK